MAKHGSPRNIDQNWPIDQHGNVLLNCLPNSTLVSGNLLEVANEHLVNTTFIRDEAETQHQHLREMVTQAEAAGRQARDHLTQHVGYLNRTRNKRDLALTRHNNQQVRFLALRTENINIMVQHLTKLYVQQLVEGNRQLARTICEFLADGINYPLFHTREARCRRMRLGHRGLTVTPSLQHLVNLGIFIARRAPVGNGTQYGLTPQFAATIPAPPRFNVPEPPLRYRYEALHKTSSDDSNGKEDK